MKATQELLAISKMITHTDKEGFIRILEKWHEQWSNFIKERTIDRKSGKSTYTYPRLRSAYLSLKRNLKWLWTFQDYRKTRNYSAESWTVLWFACWYAIDIVFPNFLYLWPNSTIRIKLWMSNEQYHILSYKNWFIIMLNSIMDSGKRDFLNWIISATTPLKIRQTISYLQVWKVKYAFQNQPFVGPVTGLIY